MKKILLVIFAIILCSSIAVSQVTIKGGISLGTVGGNDSKFSLDLSDFDPSLSGSLSAEPTTRLGFVAGAAVRIGLPIGITIQPEIWYVQKGATYKFPTIPLDILTPGLSGNATETIKLDYIEIPLMIKYSLPVPVISPYLEAGLSYSALLSAKLKTEVSLSGVPGITAPPTTETDIKADMNKSDFSIQLGAGVSIAMLEVDARYVIGLSKLDKDKKEDIYNRAIVLTLGLKL